jgi:hypothetical protein
VVAADINPVLALLSGYWEGKYMEEVLIWFILGE